MASSELSKAKDEIESLQKKTTKLETTQKIKRSNGGQNQ